MPIFKKNKTSCQMGWRYVLYRQGRKAIAFTIEPMVIGSDIVYIPSAKTWKESLPDHSAKLRVEILTYLKKQKWNRDLVWNELDGAVAKKINNSSELIIPGSLESTPGGKWLEEQRLFHPNSPFPFKQAREMWIEIDKRFSNEARGVVTIACSELIQNSVFAEVELPMLRKNKLVKLNFI